MSVVFALDPIGATSAEFDTTASYVAFQAADLASNGIRVGVVCVGSSASVVMPLQVWQNTSDLYLDISNIDCTTEGEHSSTSEGLNTAASLLGSEGSRNVILFTPGLCDTEEAEAAANSTKEAGVNIYVVGIGDMVSNEDIDRLASYPPEDYGLSIANYSSEAFAEIPLTTSIYLSK